MKKNILAVCILTLVVCLLSCDISTINGLLSNAKGKFVEEDKKVENLSFQKGNKEGQEKRLDVALKIKENIKVNEKNLQQKKDIHLSRINILTKNQEDELCVQEAKANDIKIQVNVKLSEIKGIYDELNESFSELSNMNSDIMNAQFDFDEAKKTSNNGIAGTVKQELGQSIDQVKNSRHIAMVRYEAQLNTLKLVQANTEHAKSSIESALGESVQIRLSGYYYINLMIDKILSAITSLSKAENMLKQVKSELNNIRADMQEAKENFYDLKSSHQVLKESIKR